MPNGKFEKFLVEAIDESLSSLGESPKQARALRPLGLEHIFWKR